MAATKRKQTANKERADKVTVDAYNKKNTTKFGDMPDTGNKKGGWWKNIKESFSGRKNQKDIEAARNFKPRQEAIAAEAANTKEEQEMAAVEAKRKAKADKMTGLASEAAESQIAANTKQTGIENWQRGQNIGDQEQWKKELQAQQKGVTDQRQQDAKTKEELQADKDMEAGKKGEMRRDAAAQLAQTTAGEMEVRDEKAARQ